MEPTTVLIVAALLCWVVYRQYTGRFVTQGRTIVVPLVLVGYGLVQAGNAHLAWGTAAVIAVAGSLVPTIVLGLVRGAAIRFTLVDGYLYQRGGLLSLGLWIVTIGVRVLVEVLANGTSAAPAMAATITLSIGVSLAAQAAVLMARVRADGRPLRPSGDRRTTRSRATLER